MRNFRKKQRLHWVLAFVFALGPVNLAGGALNPSQIETLQTTAATFRFHIPNEPHSLDPAKLSSSDASYFFNNVMRGLFRYTNESGLQADGAEACQFETPLRLSCRLSKNAKWSDGTPVTADDYVRSYRHLLEPQAKNPAIELLSNIKNALAVHSGQAKPESLGVTRTRDGRLVIEFERADPDFLFKLTSSLLVPLKSLDFPGPEKIESWVVNGPYRVVSWVRGRRLRLEANPHYGAGNALRPPVEVLFVSEEQTALNLYEKGELTFLRRLPTPLIATYKGRPDFIQIPVARFDYIGFGDELADQPDLRAALSYSADFRELQKIYDALGIPGCPSLPEEFTDRPTCVAFDLKKALRHWAKVTEAIKKRRLTLAFSLQGGDSIKQGAEWFQAQWKKNLGANVSLEPMENGVFLSRLQKNPPAIFRKGVGLERPTCLAALETFSAKGSENFLKLNEPKYEAILKRLGQESRPIGAGRPRQKPSARSQAICREGIEFLLSRHLLIPLGRIHFTMLTSPKFSGWNLNEMNQLDLSALKQR